MITNQTQYQRTKKALERFESELVESKKRGPAKGVHRRIHAAQLAGLQSQIEDLRNELKSFEQLRAPNVRSCFKITSIEELSTVLVHARIAAGLTQRQLAERLGLSEQQIQRYESHQYEGISLQRAAEIAKVLQLTFEGGGEYEKSQAS